MVARTFSKYRLLAVAVGASIVLVAVVYFSEVLKRHDFSNRRLWVWSMRQFGHNYVY